MPRSSGLNVSTGRTVIIGYCSSMFFLALGLLVTGYYIYGAVALSLFAVPFLIPLARRNA
ncbi:MAG: hypothetical protein MUE55_07765 [Thermoplasmata archaeon]|nr:hypothetical protein [Thermoplasmata archaeon]